MGTKWGHGCLKTYKKVLMRSLYYLWSWFVVSMELSSFTEQVSTKRSCRLHSAICARAQAYPILWFCVICCPLSFHLRFPQHRQNIFCLRWENHPWKKRGQQITQNHEMGQACTCDAQLSNFAQLVQWTWMNTRPYTIWSST